MKTKELESCPPNSNPFHYDHFRMGTTVTERIVVMYNPSQEDVVVIVDIKTGKRHQITL